MNLEEARELLPWYAVGALVPAEAQAVEALLRESPELKRELSRLRALESTLAQSEAGAPAFRDELIDDAMRRIEALEKAKAKAAREEGGRNFFERVRHALFGGWQAMPAGGRLALAVQFGLVLALATALLVPRGDRAEFGTMAGNSQTTTAGGPRITVSFQPTATEAAIRELLAGMNAEIVAGPDAQGLYIVRMPAAGNIAAETDRLSAASDVVRFAAPIEP